MTEGSNYLRAVVNERLRDEYEWQLEQVRRDEWRADHPWIGDYHLADIATEHAGTILAHELIREAMRVAKACHVLGQSDGDGRGGVYHDVLDEVISDILGIPLPGEPVKAQPMTLSPKVRRAVMVRDDWTCQECGDHRDLTIDHIHPQSAGGGHEPENLRVLCRPCNSRKGAKVG